MVATISNNLRKLRFEHDEMTQLALAEAVGVTRQTVIAIEKGKYAPSLEVAFKIAAVFSTPLEEVFQYRPLDLVVDAIKHGRPDRQREDCP